MCHSNCPYERGLDGDICTAKPRRGRYYPPDAHCNDNEDEENNEETSDE